MNACFEYEPCRAELVDSGGINALVACLAYDAHFVRATASGALLNA